MGSQVLRTVYLPEDKLQLLDEQIKVTKAAPKVSNDPHHIEHSFVMRGLQPRKRRAANETRKRKSSPILKLR